MKRIILSICMLFAVVTFASAQGGAAKRKAEINAGLKEIKLTDAQIESVLAIEAEFKPKMSAIKNDAALDDAAKKEKNKAVRLEKNSKMEATLGKDVAKKVDDFYSSLKKKKPTEEKE